MGNPSKVSPSPLLPYILLGRDFAAVCVSRLQHHEIQVRICPGKPHLGLGAHLQPRQPRTPMFRAAEAVCPQASLRKAAGRTGSSAWAGCSILTRWQHQVKGWTRSPELLKSRYLKRFKTTCLVGFWKKMHTYGFYGDYKVNLQKCLQD